MSSDETSWENRYLTCEPRSLPWNAGGPDPDLVRGVEDGAIARGQALDVGVGLGHDAVFLLENGFDVIGIDISPTAIRLARENASQHGLFGFFQVGDARQLPIEDNYVDFANDRGCLQTLEPADQEKAVRELHRVLRERGRLLLHVHSESGGGPHGMSRRRLETLLGPFFTTIEFREAPFVGVAAFPGYVLLLQKKKT